jgi:hypothetical protein
MVSARDQEFGIDSMNIKAQRVDIPTHEISLGADAWQRGQTFQIDDGLLANFPTPPPTVQKR